MSFTRLSNKYSSSRQRATTEYIRIKEGKSSGNPRVVLYVSKAMTDRMHDPEAVVFYADKKAGKLRIAPATVKEPGARKLLQASKTQVNSRQVSGGRMIKELFNCQDGIYVYDNENNWFDMTRPTEKL